MPGKARYLSRIVMGLLLLSACLPSLAASRIVAPSDTAPVLWAKTVGGGTEKIDYTAHSLTLVNFWATWCVPCKAEMPKLQELQERWSGEGFRVIGIVVDKQPDMEIVNKYLEDTGAAYTNLMADKKLRLDWGGVGMLPTSYLVSSEGKVLRRYVGGTEKQLEILLNDVETLMKGEPLGTMPLD